MRPSSLGAEQSSGNNQFLLLLTRWRRFDVDEYRGDPIELRHYRLLHVMPDAMGPAHGHVRIHFDMKIDVIPHARLASEAFLDTANATDAGGDLTDLPHEFGIGHRIHQLQ